MTDFLAKEENKELYQIFISLNKITDNEKIKFLSQVSKSKQNGGWDIPVYFCPNSQDKTELKGLWNSYMAEGLSRSEAMYNVHKEHPDKLKMLNDDKELQNIVERNREDKKTTNHSEQSEQYKQNMAKKIKSLQGLGDTSADKLTREHNNKSIQKEEGKSHFSNPSNQKHAAKVVEKMGRTPTKEEFARFKMVVSAGKEM